MTKLRILAIILLLSFSVSVSASAFDIAATGGYSMDFSTGKTLYEKNAHTPMVPASMTKIMTLFILFEELSSGNISKSTLVPVSQNAANEAARPGYTNIPLSTGENVSMDILIQAITTVSACGACTAVAEFLAGSEAEFVNLMNKKAAELGLNAVFADASGISPDTKITPASLGLLTKIFIEKYPDILNYTRAPSVTIKGKTYVSTNLLLKSGSGGYLYSGADGFKTGTTNAAGKCIVSTAVRNGRRVISVVMNAPTNADRYKDSIKILDNGFAQNIPSADYLYSTDIKAYIDGFKIPCFYYYGKLNTLCIVAENLRSFGFDVSFDDASSTLYISDVRGKEIYTMVCEEDAPLTPIYKIRGINSVRAVLLKDGAEYPLDTVLNLNGMCAISFDELGKYFSYEWNGDTRSALLNAG